MDDNGNSIADVEPGSIRRIHLVGVAGTGMGSFAGMLKAKGYVVTGSDEGVYPPMSDMLAAWGVDVMTRVNSPRVKILYDIYHVQIMDGDIVRNIRDHYQWIGHFHTGGNPGRKEIDETQELNYRFIMNAIADLGFTGYVSHEYSPTQGNDPIKALAKAMEICAV